MKTEPSLLDKYNVPVPRYTSYPPANHFREGFPEEEALRLIEQSNKGKPEHIALYFHIPFCKKICFYCGCNTSALKSGDQVDAYMKALHAEFDLVAERLDNTRKVSQLHFGGGTPNAIPTRYLAGIVDKVKTRFSFIPQPEIALETHPAYLDHTCLDAMTDAGFNRFSLGIQDFNETVLKMVNREPSQLPVGELIRRLRQKEGNRVNLDFIYGLPGQTTRSFTETIKQAIDLSPDRLVTFSYAHVPWIKKHQQILEKRGLPGPKAKMEMFLAAREQLTGAGYIPIGLDHYVKPRDELNRALEARLLHRNFQGYCTRRTTGQVYAFGTSAISQLEGGYIQNTKSIPAYTNALAQQHLPVEKGLKTSTDQVIIREAITELMCNLQVRWEEVANRLEISSAKLLDTLSPDEHRLKELEGDRLIRRGEKGIEVTGTGSLFIRNIAATLDPAYQSKVQTYSKSV